jgi:hypothetical protein
LINVDIINQALQAIGVSPIVSLDEDNQSARYSKQIYDTMLRLMLSLHRWNFATKFALLAKLTTNELSERYTYVYQVPTENIRILKVTDSDGTYETDSYIIQEGKIYTSTDSAGSYYIKYMTDVNQYPPYFIEAFVNKMASELSIPITGRTDLATYFLQKFDLTLKQAKALDAQQGTPPQNIIQSNWLSGRT